MEDLKAVDGMTPSIPGDNASARRVSILPEVSWPATPQHEPAAEVVQAQEWRLERSTG